MPPAKLRGGIDLGGTKIQTVVVGSASEVRGEARHPTPTEGGPADVARAMEDALREAASAAGVDPASLVGVGVEPPGMTDATCAVITASFSSPAPMMKHAVIRPPRVTG